MIKLVMALSPKESLMLEVSSLTVVGGKSSAARKLGSLKESGDYAVLSLGPNQELQLHNLLGKNQSVREIHPLEVVQIQDLTLIALPMQDIKIGGAPNETIKSNTEDISSLLSEVVRAFSAPDDLAGALGRTLEVLLSRYLFEKGLVVVQKVSGEFEPLVSQGLRHGDPWLSESLIQDALKSQSPIIVRNLIGSQYDTKKSLIASGFMSVCAWPLVVRGRNVGALMIGSTRPHQGLTDRELREAQTIVSVAGLLVQYHLRELKTREEVAAMRAISGKKESPFLTQNKKMLEAVRLAAQVAPTDLAILIQGETGTGKEVMARWIHERSERASRPFIAINCGAIPGELLESLLFGHKKGAFTGAVSDMAGKFQAAHQGTIFLDEIGDLPMSLQVKILRAIQEKVIEPLGANRTQQVDVRVISASHKNLTTLIEKHLFRDDLYYRLAEVTIEIPTLRDRREDIPLMATDFLREFAKDKRFSETAWEWMKLQSWKGNVRELKSAVKRVAVLSVGEEISVDDFSKGLPKALEIQSSEKSWLGGETLDEARDRFTAQKVREALVLANGRRAKAAELLGVTPRTLFRYLDQFAELLRDIPERESSVDL